MKTKQIIPLLVLLVLLTLAFYYIDVSIPAIDTVFLTVSTFLFAILAGFSISRQSTRHEDIRERIAQFDGNMTSLYRATMSLDQGLQKEIGDITKKHFQVILDTLSWDYHFNHKSNTITSIHTAIKNKLTGKDFDDLGKAILAQAEWSLRDLQRVRKDLVSLYQERIPVFQWTLLYLLASILIGTILTIPSSLLFFASVLKASFTLSIVVVLYLLHRLNSVRLFEGTIGESSAKDVIGIINGEK